MELSKALDIAKSKIEILAPECDIVHIAGSCRREKPEPKDIEIVALPKMVAGTDLFGGETEKTRTLAWKQKVHSLGEIIKGKAEGKMMQILLPEGINLDLFLPDEWDYYRQYCIRTGSADWVGRYVAGGWKKIGWCGSDAGLRLQSQCKGELDREKKMHWKCVVPKVQQMTPPHWTSEEEFFDWLKLKYIEPKLREV